MTTVVDAHRLGVLPREPRGCMSTPAVADARTVYRYAAGDGEQRA